MMKKFDVIVIGAGSALELSAAAAEKGLKVAVIDKGPFGGTCLNRGCIPSKMLIHHADVMETIKRAGEFGIKVEVKGLDWNKIQKRTWNVVDTDAANIEKGNRSMKNTTVYKAEAKFIGKKTLKVGNDEISAETILIGAGTRPRVVDFPGLKGVKYYTSDDVMRIKRQPKSMIILGGGYIAAELAHFFGALGTKITIINRSGLLITNEDEEISKAYTKIARKKYNVMLNTNVKKISKGTGGVVVETNKGKVAGEVLLLALGRVPNTDILDVAKTGVKTDEAGFVVVDGYMESKVKGIWAIGDIVGKYMLKHNANLEVAYAAHNALNPKEKAKISYKAMPHAIFSSPQIGSVGETEQALKEKKIAYGIGKYKYHDTAMGEAIEDKEGFVKVLADKEGNILGCHILGAHASSLIHEVIVAMKGDLGVSGVAQTTHIHPALNEVVERAFGNVKFK